MENMEKKDKNRKGLRIAFLIVFGVFIFLLLALVIFGLYRLKGRNSLLEHAKQQDSVAVASLSQQLDAQEQEGLKEGQIAYQGRIYEYNEDLLTFLLLGIDSKEDIRSEKIPGMGGQADTIILVVMDTGKQTIKLLNISRDTLMKVKVYDTSGIYIHEEEMQLALQYAYGNGMETSCELMEQAVSKLFYGIPIHGYGALDIKAVSELNDAVGGVEITVLEDFSHYIPKMTLGSTITLHGSDALDYVQMRNTESEILGSNNLRIARQKQYMSAFFARVKASTAKDISIPLKLYRMASRHMVTSITADQVAYLSTIALGCTFEDEDMISVGGTMQKKGPYEEFIIDEQAFYDLIIDVFYVSVE